MQVIRAYWFTDLRKNKIIPLYTKHYFNDGFDSTNTITIKDFFNITPQKQALFKSFL